MRASVFLLVVCLVGCATASLPVHEVGRREATRLRQSYSRWKKEAPRKIDWMDVPTEALSRGARDAGFLSGGADSQIVMLFTADEEGLVFGMPSPKEREGLSSLGYTLQPTVESDVFRFRFTQKKANQSPDRTPPSGVGQL